MLPLADPVAPSSVSCPRCHGPHTMEIQLTLHPTGERWFDCPSCRHVFRVPTLIQYIRDDAQQRVIVVSQADATLPQRLLVLDRQASEYTWQYAMLHESRGATRMFPSDVAAIVSHAAALARRHGPRGPEAIVAADMVTFGMARIYSTLAEQVGIAIHVFHNRPAAERWLDRGPS